MVSQFLKNAIAEIHILLLVAAAPDMTVQGGDANKEVNSNVSLSVPSVSLPHLC